MIIRSIKLKNFKKHRSLELDFDEKLNLIGGPNESGKSTVAEAIHAALFFRHNGKTKELNEFQSLTSTDGPTVELKFEQGGVTYTLTKTFLKGSNCTLTSPGRNTLVGPAAEEELGKLLSTTAPMDSHSKAKGEWAHLWVWQGTAGNNPVDALCTQREKMIDQLQEKGLIVALSSKKDQEAASKFTTLIKNIYVNQGMKFKAGSAQANAEAKLEQSENRLVNIQETIKSIESKVKQFELDRTNLESVQRNLIEKTGEYEEIKKLLEQLAILEAKVTKETELLEKLTAEEKALKNKIAEITDIKEVIEILEEKANPSIKELETVYQEINDLKKDLVQRKELVQQLEKEFAKVRLQEKYLLTLSEIQNKTSDIGLSQEKLNKIKGIANAKKVLEMDLAGLLQIKQPQLDRWSEMEAHVTTKKSVLDAIATEVEILASNQSITIDGNLFTGKVQLTKESTLALNGQNLLKIVPGGGKSLEVATREYAEAVKALEDFQRVLGLTDKQKAIEIVFKREDLEKSIQEEKAKLGAMESEQAVEQLIETTQHALAGLAQQKNSLQENEPWLGELNGGDISKKLEEIIAKNSQIIFDLSNENEQIRKKEKTLEGKENLSNGKSSEIKIENDLIAEKRTRLTLLEEQAGDVDVLFSDLSRKISSQKEVFEEVQSGIISLDPENLRLREQRIRQVLGKNTEEEKTLNLSLALLKGELKQSGGQDFYQEEQSEYARQEQLKMRFEGLRTEAKAIQLLDQLFAKENEDLTNSYAQPFAEKIKHYLSYIFGPDLSVSVSSDDSGDFNGLEIYRGQYKDLGKMDFLRLSGGTKEQLAAAVRLAMAEVLAPAYGGYLPILFDDAFAYSDKDRLKVLPDMLYSAAQKGIQVILLSCTPQDYVNLGAHEISLSA